MISDWKSGFACWLSHLLSESSALVFSTKGFPKLLIRHELFMLGTPMCIDAVPPISLKNMVTDGALPWSLRCYFFLAAEAFEILFHVYSKLNSQAHRRLWSAAEKPSVCNALSVMYQVFMTPQTLQLWQISSVPSG